MSNSLSYRCEYNGVNHHRQCEANITGTDLRQDNSIRSAVGVTLLSITLSGCLMQSGGGTSSEQSRVMVSEVMSICGAIIGDQAEQRINQVWSKYQWSRLKYR